MACFSIEHPLEMDKSSGHVVDTDRKTKLTEPSLVHIADGRNNEHVVHIDKWVSSLTRILEDVPQYMCHPGHPGRLSRIPENLREVDVKAYEPHFLSIGPYHHSKPKVQKMEKRKWLILKSFLEQRPEITLKDYLKEIKSIEPAIGSFYSDVEMDSENFVQMMLLDSLYILTFFCGRPKGREMSSQKNRVALDRVDNKVVNDKGDQINEGLETQDHNGNTQMMARTDQSNDKTRRPTTTPRWSLILFMHDLFLLENQIPFFLLQKIYALVYGGSEELLTDTIKDKVGNMLLSYTKLDSKMVILQTEEVHHLLHLCHMFFRPTVQQVSTSQLPESSHMFRLGSAVQLYEAGVVFEARSDSSQYSLLDVTVDTSGKVVMSSLHVDDDTVSLLRNLIALEQMKYPSLGLHVSAYAVLMLHLVTIPEDVKLLRRKGIIEHHLASDKEMVSLINRLSLGLAFDYVEDNYSLKPVFQELKSYSERKVPKWRAWLIHRYFNNPWTVISLFAASFLLLLSFVQTYYTVYSYYYPCSYCHS